MISLYVGFSQLMFDYEVLATDIDDEVILVGIMHFADFENALRIGQEKILQREYQKC